ncbi:hypothetical protein V1264_006804 [Littorina saxatilis]|uniref:Chitin-binding type-2 domain-containing protein n=1 Tax=Littorina saxatilis TaxID=31220 RepID=A0AAN9AYN9_9CAEN
MRGLLLLALVALVIATVQASTCSYRSTRSCGFWNWRRCSYTAYKSCVHGGWSGWTEQSRTGCSRQCGTGSQIITKTRTCTNPRPSNGGRQCSGQTSMRVSASCNTQRCPVNGGWSAWTQQSRTACTKSCGTGSQIITNVRTCTNPSPAYGGRSCYGSSRTQQTLRCNTQLCPVNGGWSNYAERSRTPCTKSCGTGSQIATSVRSCTNPAPAHGGRSCSGSGSKQDTLSCNTHPCPINGGWTDYAEQSRTACTKSCGTGSQIATSVRSCTNPAPAHGGRSCSGSGSKQDTVSCNTHPCPINGGWTDFAEQSRTACTKSCGNGSQIATSVRTCTSPAPAHGGRSCSGSSSKQDTLSCNTHPCPINGGWTDYAEQSRTACTKSCGTGSQIATSVRTCTNPAPAHGGRSCSGSSSKQDTVSCNTHPCPINGGWTDYAEQSRTACTKSCGNGSQIATSVRTCTSPAPAYGGTSCSGSSSKQDTLSCNTHPCPINGGWTDFAEQSRTACSKSCGTGNEIATHVRTCTNPAPAHGGTSCSGSSSMQTTHSCNTHPCPIDGVWTDWSDWDSTTKCTVLCGSGEKDQTRDRSCTNPAPRYGGRACAGEDRQNQTVACNTDDCGDRCPVGADTYIEAGDQHYYYRCQQGQNNSVSTKALLMKCPKKTVWSQDTKNCIHRPDDSTPAPAPAASCTEGATRADPTDDCTYYFQCIGGSETRRPCAAGTKFDNSLGLCNIASIVNCASG